MKTKKQKGRQIEVTDKIRETSLKIKGTGKDYFNNVLDWINNNINYKEYNRETSEHEKSIRWKRTAEQILQDGYIYKQKGCTDMVILFQAVCEAKGYNTKGNLIGRLCNRFEAKQPVGLNSFEPFTLLVNLSVYYQIEVDADPSTALGKGREL